MKNTSKIRSRGRPTTFHRESVVSLAMNCYWHEGVNSLSINELCRRLNIAKPTLYREFGGEDGLLQAALEHYTKEVLQSLLLITTQAPTLQIGLQEVIVTTTSKSPPIGCLFVKMRQNKVKLGPKSCILVEQLQEKLQSLYMELVATEQKKGLLRADIDTALAAKYIDTQLMMTAEQMSRGEDKEIVQKQAELALSVLFQSNRQ